MSFIKKVWKKGNKLTVKELNRIEEGIDSLLQNNNNNNNNDNNNKIITIEMDSALDSIISCDCSVEDYETAYQENKNIYVQIFDVSETGEGIKFQLSGSGTASWRYKRIILFMNGYRSGVDTTSCEAYVIGTDWEILIETDSNTKVLKLYGPGFGAPRELPSPIINN